MTTVRFKIELGKPKRPPTPKPPPVVRDPGPSRAARRLALAYWIERNIEAGNLPDYATAARVLGLSRARLTQVVNSVLLPSLVQEEVLLGRCVAHERAPRVAALADGPPVVDGFSLERKPDGPARADPTPVE